MDSIDPALLRKGRLGQLVEMKGPNRSEAAALLKYFAEKYKLEGEKTSPQCVVYLAPLRTYLY